MSRAISSGEARPNLLPTRSIGALLLAALCTVVLIFSARHATLRQVSLALMQISEQAKQLSSAGKTEEGHEPKNV